MTKLAIVGMGYRTEEHIVVHFNTSDRMMSWLKAGALGRHLAAAVWHGLLRHHINRSGARRGSTRRQDYSSD